jgi:hypothetical protein
MTWRRRRRKEGEGGRMRRRKAGMEGYRGEEEEAYDGG